MSLKSVARGRGREGHSGSWRDNLDYSFEKTQFINPGRGCHQGKNGGGVDELSGKTRGDSEKMDFCASSRKKTLIELNLAHRNF